MLLALAACRGKGTEVGGAAVPASAGAASPPLATPAGMAPVPVRAPGSASEVEQRLRDLGSPAVRNQAIHALAAAGKDVVPRVLPVLEDPEWSRRWDAVEVLAMIKDARAIPGLTERVLGDDNQHVRWRALYSLSENDPGGAVSRDVLAQALAGSDARRSWNAAVALSFLQDKRGLDRIRAGLLDPDGWTRWEAVNALGNAHDAETSGILAPLLASDPDPSVRKETVMTLGRICDARAKEVLRSALTHADPAIRARAAMGIGSCADTSARALLETRKREEPDQSVTEHIDQALRVLPAR